ncbi:FG-GAP-like repeat-containing protein [Chloroflexota bacterium]
MEHRRYSAVLLSLPIAAFLGLALGIILAAPPARASIGDQDGAHPSIQSGGLLPQALSEGAWDELIRLTSGDGRQWDEFGESVAVDGDTIVVGARNAHIGSNNDEGAAYVFVKPPGGRWTDATQVAKLTASDGQAYHCFGWRVAIDGDTIVVTSWVDGGYVFVKPPGGWTDMTETARLTTRDSDSLGHSVAMDGDTVVVADDTNYVGGKASTGALYVFVKPDTGWTDMTHTAKLTVAGGWYNDSLGWSLDMEGDTVVGGAIGVDIDGKESQGAAYVFVKPASGWITMTQTARLLAGDGEALDRLGQSVGIGADAIVVGAPDEYLGDEDPGAAYLFLKPEGGWITMTHSAKLTAGDGAAGDQLGWSAALDGDRILVGANRADAAYLFDKPSGGWSSMTHTAKLTTADSDSGDYFGESVALGEGIAVVGAVHEDVGGNPGQGAAHVFGSSTAPDLSLVKTVEPSLAAPGQSITYTLTYANHGTEGATAVRITDTVPVTLTNLSYVSSGAVITDAGLGNYVWRVADLSPGEGGIITITGDVDPSAAGVFSMTNKATIGCNEPEPNLLDNRSVVTHTIDADAPITPVLISPTSGAVINDDTPTLTWQPSPSGDVAGYLVKLNGNTVDAGNVTQYTVAPALSEGIHTWTVAAYDGAGNASAFASPWTFTVDVTIPQPPTLLTPPDDDYINDDTPTLTWQASPSGDVAGYELTLGGVGTDVGNVTQYTVTPSLADDHYAWSMVSYDAAGNQSFSTDSWDFTVDTTPPTTPALLLPLDGAYTNDVTPTLKWQAGPDADVAGYRLKLNGIETDMGFRTEYTIPVALPESPATWTIAAYDVLGNEGDYADTWTFTVDTTPPDPAVLLSPPDGTFASDNPPTLRWQASPSPDAAGYMLDFGGTITDVGNHTRYTTTVLSDGTYTWTVAAYDGARNSSGYTDTWSFDADEPPEPPTLLQPAHGTLTGDNTPKLSWQASPSPDVSGYLLDLGGGLVIVGNSTEYTPTILSDGTYTWTVAAYDAVGNPSPYTGIWTFTVDTTPPDPPVLISPPDGTITSDDMPALVWQPSPSPDAAGYTLSLSGTITDVGPATEYIVNPALANGTYTWTVAAYDALAWTGAYADVWSLTVDTAFTPRVTGVQPPTNSHTAALTTSLTVTVNDVVSPTTVTTRTMTVHGGFQGRLDGGFHFSDVVFNPAHDFHPGELVDVSVTNRVQAGKNGVEPYVWQFRSGVGGGEGRFTSGQPLRDPNKAWNATLGDLNGDGHLDVVVVRYWGKDHDPSSVCLNDGTGAFGPSCQDLSLAQSRAVALGDLDGDGDLDLFFANGQTNPDTSKANFVYVNQGGTQGGTAGTFAHGWTQSSDLSLSTDVALGDLDGDGDLDAFIGTTDKEAARVWTNDRSGIFTAGWIEGSDPSDYATTNDVELGDLDGDGDLDAFEGNHESNRVWVNDGGAQGGTMGTFRAGWEQASDAVMTMGVALGDLDGDGDLDALVANVNSVEVIWENQGDGSFSRSALSPDRVTSGDVELGDLEGDGDLDAFVTTWFDPDQVWRNDGNLAFTKVQGLDPAILEPGSGDQGSGGIALGDLDGDGDLDIAVGAGTYLAVWFNQDATLPPSGGSLSPAPGVTITVPSGAFTDTVVINFVPHPITSTGSLKNVGFFFDLNAAYLSSGEQATLQPGKRYTITVTYDQADVPPGVNEADLALFYHTGSDYSGRPLWKKEPTSVVDTVANTITATPDHFSLWAALEGGYQVNLPVVVREGQGP